MKETIMKVIVVVLSLILLFLIGCIIIDFTRQDASTVDSSVGQQKKDKGTTDSSVEKPKKEQTYDYEMDDLGPIDVEKYLNDLGKVISSKKVEESKNILSEKEVTELLSSRGITQAPIEAEYSFSGDYIGSEISHDSDEKHPMYVTYYGSSSGELWTINVIGNKVTAYPVMYSLDSNQAKAIIFAESKSLFSYDGVTNTLYEFIPDSDVMVVAVLDKIDSNALEKLTTKEIDKYFNNK